MKQSTLKSCPSYTKKPLPVPSPGPDTPPHSRRLQPSNLRVRKLHSRLRRRGVSWWWGGGRGDPGHTPITNNASVNIFSILQLIPKNTHPQGQRRHIDKEGSTGVGISVLRMSDLRVDFPLVFPHKNLLKSQFFSSHDLDRLPRRFEKI